MVKYYYLTNANKNFVVSASNAQTKEINNYLKTKNFKNLNRKEITQKSFELLRKVRKIQYTFYSGITKCYISVYGV